MKKSILLLILFLSLYLFSGCMAENPAPQVAVTTLPVYEFTTQLCHGTDISIGRVVTENVSCLHDYSLQTAQMRMLESAQLIVISGAGLEDFLDLSSDHTVCDASAGIELLCAEHDHSEHSGHTHESDPHIWLSPENAKHMCENICENLCKIYPEHTKAFQSNLQVLLLELDTLQSYGDSTLSSLSCREMITFHDGFGYFADTFDLKILKAVEEESGSEASAAELIELIGLVQQHQLPSIFTEQNGSVSAADIIAAETGASVFCLDMGMGDAGYFEAMYHNIDTIKEALG